MFKCKEETNTKVSRNAPTKAERSPIGRWDARRFGGAWQVFAYGLPESHGSVRLIADAAIMLLSERRLADRDDAQQVGGAGHAFA